MKKMLRIVTCLVVLACVSALASAAEPWPHVGFKYFARQYTLSRVLTDFSSSFGVRLVFDPSLQGNVTGEFNAPNPSEFLNTMGASYGFNWYCQAGVLHISPSNEWATQVLHVGMTASDVSALKSQLNALGLFESRFGWAEFPGRGIVIVSGPQEYVKSITSIVGSLGTGPSDGRQLRVFRLQNARAEDYTFTYQGESVVTPGVATLLRNLAAGSIEQQSQNPSTGPLSVAPTALKTAPMIAPLEGIDGQVGPIDARKPVDVKTSSGAGVAVNAGANALTPVIEPDPRLNSVIIYDAPEKMPVYEALIRELDEERPQIQIEAMIVDVATDKIDSLGVAWRAGSGDVKAGFGQAGGQGTILSINTGSFFARVNALVTEGSARVLGRPSVLTLDNLSAVLSLQETLYARVSGVRDDRRGGSGGSYGSLVPITTGTTLKVIPRMIDERGRQDVSMAVQIEDGQILKDPDGNGSESLPTVRQSTINTQAVVQANDCLLIGGYFVESDSLVENRVPGLSKIPLVGGLFRDKTSEHKRSARLFVIRPTIILGPNAIAANITK